MSSPDLPPFAWLRAFEAAARHLSFTAAAVELNLTQSAISQHVRSLEAFLGKPMFLRRPRGLALTEDGANYLPAVREAFAALVTGAQPFAGTGFARRSKAVTLQCNMSFATFRLVPRLAELTAALPDLRLNIVTPVWDPERTAQTADVEIRFARPDDADHSGRRLTHERCYPVCTPSVAARIAEGVDWRTLPLFDCAGVLAGWQGWLAARNEVLDRPVHMASTFAVSIGAALAGAGLAMAHHGLVVDALADRRLVRPFAATTPMAECYVLLQPARHMRTPASRALTDWLIATFADASLGGQAGG